MQKSEEGTIFRLLPGIFDIVPLLSAAVPSAMGLKPISYTEQARS